ncbi:DUF5992 family protein [Enterovibrio norvegicus]|uniref:DUF5992 family protein n=1 Tax=Enterovibrio norvegicus TaxID=188144 RepID=UPI00354C1320
MKKISVILSAFSLIATANATPVVIADGSTIAAMGNSHKNERNFFVNVKGGDTSCTVITFPLADAGKAGNDEGIHARAYSAALAAFTAGKRVVITNFKNDSCDNASKIKLVN